MDHLQKYKSIFNTLCFLGVLLGLAFLLLSSFSNHSRVILVLETIIVFLDLILFSIGIVYFIKIQKTEKMNKRENKNRDNEQK